MRVLYGVRRPGLLIYKDTLDNAKQQWPSFGWHAYVEKDVPPWASHGQLSATAALTAAEEIGGIRNAIHYLSGPPEMIKSLKEGLTQAGILTNQIRIDAWD
jgi:NAD(P)H-flavin reductase